MLGLRSAAILFLGAFAAPASAHGGHVHARPGWSFDPVLVVPLGLVLLVYAVGWARLSRRASAKVDPRLFLAGWLVLALAAVSPLHEAGELSFTWHMVEHELIMLVATLLLAASRAGAVLAWGLPRPLRLALAGSWKSPVQAIWRRLTEPVTATALQGAVMWIWHAPVLFNRALQSEGWHIAQHLSFFVTALLFWWAMLNPRGRGYGLSAACLFATSLIGGALGALMSFSTSPWYSEYAAMGMSGIGLDPVDDQRLAGLIMWVPGGLVHAGAALVLCYKWLKSSEGRGAVTLH